MTTPDRSVARPWGWTTIDGPAGDALAAARTALADAEAAGHDDAIADARAELARAYRVAVA